MGTLAISAKRYIAEKINKIEGKVGALKKERLPIENGLNVELDDSPILGPEENKWYRSLISMAL